MKKNFKELRFRQVHLDFHTSEHIGEVGKKFKAKDFIATLKKANVDSITVFAMCHHGWCYYDTKIGKKHPNLKIDLLGKMLPALKKANIEAPVYLTVGWNELVGREHPDWCVVDKDGKMYEAFSPEQKRMSPKELAAVDPETCKPWGWRRICVNSPYLDYLLKITEEVMTKFAPIGIFYDITGEEKCYCKYCRKSMLDKGLDIEKPHDVEKLAKEVYRNYLAKTSELIWKLNPRTRIYHNSSDKKGRDDLYDTFSHYEIESLPSSFWGYEHFPQNAKYFQWKGFDFLGMTGKFHEMWGEFGGYKNPVALKYECARMIALGAKCSIGDQMPPTGQLDNETYRIIGETYRYVKEREKWCRNVVPVADIGVLCPSAIAKDRGIGHDSEIGVSMMLFETQQQFLMIDETADFADFKLIIMPDHVTVDSNLKAKLGEYLANGGKLLLSGVSGLNPEQNCFELDFGAKFAKMPTWDVDYTVVHKKIGRNLVSSPFFNYSGGVVTELTDGKVLASTFEPFFRRTYGHFCSHGNTPPSGKDAGYPSVVMKKNIIYIAQKVFEFYGRKGMKLHRDLVNNCIEILLPEKIVTTSLQSCALVNLTKRPANEDYVLHLIYAVPIKRGAIQVVEDIVPIYDTEIELRIPEKIESISLVPSGKKLKFKYKNGIAKFNVPKIKMHQMVCLAYK